MAIAVRGKCKVCGKVYDTVADAGHTTARFHCTEPGCYGSVMARRVRDPDAVAAAVAAAAEDAAAADLQPTPAPATTRKRKRARRVDGYRRDPGSPEPKRPQRARAPKSSTPDAAGPEHEQRRPEHEQPKPEPAAEPRKHGGRARPRHGVTPYDDLY